MPKRIGDCCICGTHGKLSFEHLPPQSAFNNSTVTMTDFETALEIHPLDPPKGKFKQGGFGKYTLCESCNNDTGGWYGPEYVSWAQQAAAVLQHTNNDPASMYEFRGYPLRFVKQAVAMLLSGAGSDFRKTYPQLAEFVLSREQLFLPADLQLYSFYNATNIIRNFSVSGASNISTGEFSAFVEFAAYPFGFLLTLGTPPPDDRLLNISSFAGFGYDQLITMGIQMPSLAVIAPFPGIYHTYHEFATMTKPEDG